MKKIKETDKRVLSVFREHYYPWNSLSNIWSNIKCFFRHFKYAYQRAHYGFCDRDCWNLDLYYGRLFYHTLKNLSENTYSYPSYYEKYKDWQNTLNEMAEHFYNSIEENDEEVYDIVDKAYDKMESYTDNHSISRESYKNKKDYNKARKQWLEYEKAYSKYRELQKDIGLTMLDKYWFDLWD